MWAHSLFGRLHGVRNIGNLLDATIHMPPTRLDPFDLIVCAARQSLNAENCITAIRQGEGEGHHNGLIHLRTRRLYHRKSQVDANNRDVAPAEHLVCGLVQSEKVGFSICAGFCAGVIGTSNHDPHEFVTPFWDV